MMLAKASPNLHHRRRNTVGIFQDSGERRRFMFATLYFVGFLLMTALLLMTAALFVPAQYRRVTEKSDNVAQNAMVPVKHWYQLRTPFYSRVGYDGSKDLPRVLIWTSINGGGPTGLRDIDYVEFEQQCPQRCYVTNDRRLVKSADAVVFYGRDSSPDDVPRTRQPYQKWVYWSEDSPISCVPWSVASLKMTFNWTMTRHSNSDIEPPEDSRNGMRYAKGELLKNWKEKSKMVLWIVDDCRTFEKGRSYVAELNEHIAVDIYGKTQGCVRNRCNCLEDINCLKKYAFLLSFKMGSSKDGVYGGFPLHLRIGIIAVVVVGPDANATNTGGSFILASDFGSPKYLAMHLNTIRADAELYWSYVGERWEDASVPRRPDCNFCAICRGLYSKRFNEVTSYQSMPEWLGTPLCGCDVRRER